MSDDENNINNENENDNEEEMNEWGDKCAECEPHTLETDFGDIEWFGSCCTSKCGQNNGVSKIIFVVLLSNIIICYVYSLLTIKKMLSVARELD